MKSLLITNLILLSIFAGIVAYKLIKTILKGKRRNNNEKK